MMIWKQFDVEDNNDTALRKIVKKITMTRIIFYRGKAGPRLHLLIPGETASTSSRPQTCKILHFLNIS